MFCFVFSPLHGQLTDVFDGSGLLKNVTQLDKLKTGYEEKIKQIISEWETKYNLKIEEFNARIQQLIQQYESEKLTHDKLKLLFAEMKDKFEKEIAELKLKILE